MTDKSLDAFIKKDTRSPLRRALGASAAGVGAVSPPLDFGGSGDRLRGIPLSLRVLNAGETERVRVDAHRWLRDTCGESEDFIGYSDAGRALMEFEVKLRTVAHALVEPAPPNRHVCADSEGNASPDEARTLLDADEVSALFEHYLDWLSERSPIQSKSLDDLREVIDSLGKGTTPLSRLNGFDAATLRCIVREQVALVRKRMNSPSSPTSPLSDENETSNTP